MEKKRHNCKKHLEEVSQEAGTLLKGFEETDVVGIKYRCQVCGKRFGRIMRQEHPHWNSTFYI